MGHPCFNGLLSSCSDPGLLLVQFHELLITVTCFLAQALGCDVFNSLRRPWHVGSSWTRNWTSVPWTGRWNLNHWTPREDLEGEGILTTGPLWKFLQVIDLDAKTYDGSLVHLCNWPESWRNTWAENQAIWLLTLNLPPPSSAAFVHHCKSF